MDEGHLQRTLGVNLRAWRKERGLSQEDLAHILGYHRTYVGGLERGERNATLKSVERIAKSLDVDPVALVVTAAPLRSHRFFNHSAADLEVFRPVLKVIYHLEHLQDRISDALGAPPVKLSPWADYLFEVEDEDGPNLSLIHI